MLPYLSFNKCRDFLQQQKIDELVGDASIHVIVHISSVDDVTIHP
jgi:hypothetical protein